MLFLEPEVNTKVAFVSKNLDFPQTRIRKHRQIYVSTMAKQSLSPDYFLKKNPFITF